MTADHEALRRRVLTVAPHLEHHGRLEARTEPNGDVSLGWTPAADTALDLNALTGVEGRQN